MEGKAVGRDDRKGLEDLQGRQLDLRQGWTGSLSSAGVGRSTGNKLSPLEKPERTGLPKAKADPDAGDHDRFPDEGLNRHCSHRVGQDTGLSAADRQLRAASRKDYWHQQRERALRPHSGPFPGTRRANRTRIHQDLPRTQSPVDPVSGWEAARDPVHRALEGRRRDHRHSGTNKVDG